MSRGDIILGVENFKFTIFDSVPKPEQDMAYILYRSNGGSVLVITPNKPVLSSDIRSGGYDKKMKISIAERKCEFQRQILDDTGNFRFNIVVDLTYRMANIEYIFSNNVWNFEDEILHNLIQVIEAEHKKYGIENQIELEREIRIKSIQALHKMAYLEIISFQIDVRPDDKAQQIIDDKIDTIVDNFTQKNALERASVELEVKKSVEIQRLEAEKEIEKTQIEVILEKARGHNALKELLGDSYGLFLAYSRGEINGVQFDEKMRNNRNAEMSSKILALKQLVELDVLSGPALEKAAIKLLGEGENASDTGQQVLGVEPDEEVIIEDTERY